MYRNRRSFTREKKRNWIAKLIYIIFSTKFLKLYFFSKHCSFFQIIFLNWFISLIDCLSSRLVSSQALFVFHVHIYGRVSRSTYNDGNVAKKMAAREKRTKERHIALYTNRNTREIIPNKHSQWDLFSKNLNNSFREPEIKVRRLSISSVLSIISCVSYNFIVRIWLSTIKSRI